MKNKRSANSAQVSRFSLTIIGPQSPDRPKLLGRDIHYVLNVKAIGQDGQVVEGVRYTVSCEIHHNAWISFSGRGEVRVSTAAGEDFSIYGTPARTAASHDYMNQPMQVIVTSDAGVSTQVDYRMGRLCKWAPPHAYLDPKGHWWITSYTEWMGEGTSAQWHWSRNVENAHLNIPSKSIVRSRFTYPLFGDDKNLPVRVAFPFNREDFTEGERFHMSMPSSWNDYTATLPYEGEVVVMDNKSSANSAQVSEFRLSITKGEQSPNRPELLGRDVRYTLNVKAIGSEGQVIEGVRYTVSCDLPSNSWIAFPGRGEEKISTAAGEDFSIYATPPAHASLHPHMDVPFQVFVRSDAGVSTDFGYLMGRLCKWTTPIAYFGPDGTPWITSHTEWAGEGHTGQWSWSRNVDEAHLHIPSKELEASRFTYPYGSSNWNLAVGSDLPFHKGDFTAGESFHVVMPSSSVTYTATLPYEGEVVVRSKSKDVEK